MEVDNAKLDKQVKVILNKIEVNNLLKEIDTEELQLIAKNNKEMNTALEKMMIRLNKSNNDGKDEWGLFLKKTLNLFNIHEKLIVIIFFENLNLAFFKM